jgi:hypothetical protein
MIPERIRGTRRDFWGVAASILWIVHCLATPMIVAAIPALAGKSNAPPTEQSATVTDERSSCCECCKDEECELVGPEPRIEEATCTTAACCAECPAPWPCRGLSGFAFGIGLWTLLPGYH